MREMNKGFRLGGKDYSLSRKEVEHLLKDVSPNPVDKYFVMVNGTAYPPKQVVAVALGIPLVSFTTMDASRILASLGIELLTRERKIQQFNDLLPIDGQTFQTSKGEWRAVVTRWPIPPQDSTVLLYEIDFRGPSVRHLKLWVPGEIGVEQRQPEALQAVQLWLEGNEGNGEIRTCF